VSLEGVAIVRGRATIKLHASRLPCVGARAGKSPVLEVGSWPLGAAVHCISR
jgi:hypothetical protein